MKIEKIRGNVILRSNATKNPEELHVTHAAPGFRCTNVGFVLAALFLAAAPHVHAQSAQPWKQIKTPPLHDFHPVQPKRIELANGLVIFLAEDHELPFIDGSITIRGGSRDESAAQTGLVDIYGEAWRTSGTAAISGDTLDEQLAEKAASIETTGGVASTSLSWSCLKEDEPTVFRDALDLLLHPAFKPDKLALARRGEEAGIVRQNDDASGIAGREAAKMVYGADSPYARQPQFSTIEPLTIADLQAWHDKTVLPNDMIVAVSGDFDPVAMEAALRKAFGGLKRGPAFVDAKIAFPGPKPGTYFVDKQDIDQSTLYVAGLGTERSNPDYYALSVMNEIFSGGFGSRLVQNVRTKLGLAYEVDGSYGAAYDHPGPFFVMAATKSSTTVAATQAVLAEINRLKTDPPTPEELESAKEQILNSFIFRYDTHEKTLDEQVVLAFYGYPPGFLEKYKANIEKVTATDVSRVANKYVDTGKLAVLVVGNGSQIDPPLTKLGPVTPVDITINMTGAPQN
ncbi:MAG TPA: pitrilysin family protein [Acidobacteriaceae bacterium]|nr:pitrilysin family protein [Acidobacteriaceae bacterium]